ncbi:MAG: hypothetical protein AAF810_01670 [Cyanobacteria bacterium P01_D01_bin.36]
MTMTSVSVPLSSDSLDQTRQQLGALSAAMASGALAKTPVLLRLQTALHEEIENCDGEAPLGEDRTHLQDAPFEAQLEQQARLCWLCNQCQYYLSTSSTDKAPIRRDRTLWQLRAIVVAIAKFRLIVHLRSLFPGRAPSSLEWRDILPGLKLWF